MFTYNLWMGCLHAPRYIMSIIVSRYQHCDDRATISETLMCTLHIFFSNKARFGHTGTVILDYILALEKNTRTPRVHLVFI